MHSANWNTTGICVEFWQGFHHPCSSSSSNWPNVWCANLPSKSKTDSCFEDLSIPLHLPWQMPKWELQRTAAGKCWDKIVADETTCRDRSQRKWSYNFTLNSSVVRIICICVDFCKSDFGAGLTAMRINLDEANTEEVWDHSTNCRCVSRFICSLWDLPIILLL